MRTEELRQEVTGFDDEPGAKIRFWSRDERMDGTLCDVKFT
jgi:hypothetical protein